MNRLTGLFDSERRPIRRTALIVGIDGIVQANMPTVIELTARHRLPGIYSSREHVEAGGLMSFGVNYPDLFRRAAEYVDRIMPQ